MAAAIGSGGVGSMADGKGTNMLAVVGADMEEGRTLWSTQLLVTVAGVKICTKLR